MTGAVPGEEEAYRLNPAFAKFLNVVPSIQQAAAAWKIAKDYFDPTTEEAEFEVVQGDIPVASASGPRGRALAEALHYAVVYQTDEEPCIINEIIRRELSPEDAEDMLALAIEAEKTAS